MALPNISTPEFITNIPSTGEEIKYRPFLVKEEKLLLMAMEGKDQKEIQNSVQKILINCILTPIDINKLATFDIEYLFLKLRSKSVGEVVQIKVGHTDSECSHRTDVSVNVDDVKVVGEILDGKIMLTDDIGVVLRYPNMSDIQTVIGENTDALFKLVYRCIDYVFDQEQVYNDFTAQEIEEWMESLNQGQFQKISEFFNSVPRLSHDITWKCTQCDQEEKITLEGLQSFFT